MSFFFKKIYIQFGTVVKMINSEGSGNKKVKIEKLKMLKEQTENGWKKVEKFIEQSCVMVVPCCVVLFVVAGSVEMYTELGAIYCAEVLLPCSRRKSVTTRARLLCGNCH